MNQGEIFEIRKYAFNNNLFSEFQNFHYAKSLWPIVYILSDGNRKEAYVGETTDTYSRMSSHLRSDEKNTLTAVHLISSDKFNKSATLDIESNLIKYISGDGQYSLINGNIGLANHNYYQKNEVYWHIFNSIWEKLRGEGLAKHSIEFINNSDLFKYSPYKSLNHDQKQSLLEIIRNLLRDDVRDFVVHGGAGTGKTILAVFLFKLLNGRNEDFNFREFGDDEIEFLRQIDKLRGKFQNPKMALVVPMSSFRNTLKKVFKNVRGLNANMVIGPAEVTNNKFDIIIVDEAHRLRRRVNLGAYYGAFDKASERLGMDKNTCSELDWVLNQSRKVILFYDENQSIKPSDTKKADFYKLKALKSTLTLYLKSQLRVKGGKDYVNYVHNLLACSFTSSRSSFTSNSYEFILFDSIEELVSKVKEMDSAYGLSRLIAGYSWPWESKDDKNRFDIKIGNVKLRWNSVADDWVNSKSAIEEVGCIHTTQGYDLNYAGIIFGNEISYDKLKNEIVILKDNYFDKNGKQSINNPEELKSFIVNIYKTIMLRAIKGTFVYVCDEKLREYFANHITINSKKSIDASDTDKIIPFENSVPLYNLRAAAGSFSNEQIVDTSDFEWVKLPEGTRYSEDLFACIVLGDSMNRVIPNGSVCLFRKYSGGSRNGKIVLAEHSSIQDPDFGSCYTVKEYHSQKQIDSDQWAHESIVLKPLSYNPEYAEIKISNDETNGMRVVGIFESILK